MDNITIKVENGQLLVSSLEVAENFGKNHKDVVRSIRNLINSTAQNCAMLFYKTTYTNENNRKFHESRWLLITSNGLYRKRSG